MFSVRLLIAVISSVLVFSSDSFSASQVIFGPKTYSPQILKIGDYRDQFTATNQVGTLKLENGDGRDVAIPSCSGNLVKRLLCEASNLITLAQLAITRPTSFSIEVNGVVVATHQNLPLQKGTLQIALTQKPQNSIRVRVGGLPTAKLKLEVSESTSNVNQNPLASFQMSHSQGFAPLTVSFNGLQSSDPDGQIVEHNWDFGNGTGATGAVVSHIFLQPGTFNIKLTVRDNQGATASLVKQVLVIQNQPPAADLKLVSSGSGYAPLMVMFDGSSSADPENSTLRFFWNFGDGTQIEGSSRETHEFKNAGSYTVVLQVRDENGGVAQATASISVTEPQLPPNPETVAPSLAEIANPTFEDKISFLYTGNNPIQTGVVVEKIDPKRLSVVRGIVLDDLGHPLSGVTVKILNEGDFGSTISRADGAYDLAFNSGDFITLQFVKNGYAPAQRKVVVNGQDYYTAEELRLVPLDSKVTEITLGANVSQVAQGSKQVDQSGERTGTIIFPPQVGASLVMPDGSTKSVSNLNIRVTEFTVGEDGSKKMPATLPRQTGYTYAMSVTSDEAIALGAKTIRFTKPVSYYVENFLNFPVGVAVPVGTYDHTEGVWKPELDGIVLKVVSRTASGVAQVDLGAGRVATVSELSSLGFDDIELKALAEKYPDGASLWRMTTNHFSEIDLNPSMDSDTIENVSDAEEGDIDEKIPEEPCSGCIIKVESKVLEEHLDIPGSNVRLNYSTDRMAGKKTGGVVDILVTPSVIPNSLKRVDLKVDVAGRVFKKSFAPGTNINFIYNWDGFDAYGRAPSDLVVAKVSVVYVLDEKYKLNTYAPGVSSFGSSIAGSNSVSVAARAETNIEKVFNISLKASQRLDNAAIRSVANGWFVDKHHIYDPRQNALFFGDGNNLMLSQLPKVYKTLVGGRGPGYSGDGGQARFAQLNSPSGVAASVDGSIYIADTGNNRIRKVDSAGVISTVAGNGLQGFSGDGGLAEDATLNNPKNIKVNRDGTYFIVDTGNHCIRFVDELGRISTFAGVCGQAGFTVGEKTSAKLNFPRDIVSNGDGSFYISDTGNHSIRRVNASGELTTVAGNGVAGISLDDVYASEAQFNLPRVTDIDSNGALYIADTGNNIVRKISANGRVRTIIGTGETDFNGFFVFGTQYNLGQPSFVSALPSGEIAFVNRTQKTISYLDLNGMVNPLIGYRLSDDPIDSDYATGTTAKIEDVQGIFVNPDGSRLFVDSGLNSVSIFDAVKPEKSGDNYSIASTDGSEVFIFDSSGRHLRTLFGKTGHLKFNFEYDASGYLTAIVDSFNNRTEFVRSAGGTLSQIVGPYGHTTSFTVNSNGYLESMTTPTGDRTEVGYTSQGLMTSFRKPKGNTSTYTYNAIGELESDLNPQGGEQRISKIDGFNTRYSNSAGKTFTIKQLTDDDGYEKTTTDALGLSRYDYIYSGTLANEDWDGTFSETVQQYDKRARGITSHLGRSETWSLNGLWEIRETRRNYQFPTNNYFNYILDEQIYTDTNAVATRRYVSANKAETLTSPEGRQVVTVIDDFERPVSTSTGTLEPSVLQYDSRGRLSKAKQAERETQYFYDSAGRLSQIVDAMGRQFSFGYDASDRVISKGQPDGRVTHYSYDKNSNISAIKPPSREWHQMVFGLLDFMTQYSPPENNSVVNASTFSYNSSKEILTETRADGVVLEHSYQGGTRRPTGVEKSDGSQFSRITYDPTNGKIQTITSSDNVTLTYSHDSFLLGSVSYSGAVVANIQNHYASGAKGGSFLIAGQTVVNSYMDRQYDADKKIVKVGEMTIATDSNGLIESNQLGSLQEIYSYNKFGEISEKTVFKGSSELFAEKYTRDNLGRISEKEVRVQGTVKILGYTYDLSGRLEQVSLNGQTSKVYQYDAQGNRMGDRTQYDAEDRLLNSGDTQYTYTRNGELSTKINNLNGEITRYHYDIFGSLKSVELPGGRSVQYLTDGNHRRVARVVDGVPVAKYIYDGAGQLVAELNPDNSLKSHFFYATQKHSPDGMVSGGTFYKFVKDQLGSIRMVVDSSSGDIVQAIEYDEYGVVLSDTNPGYQPFGFAGGLYDPETKLVRFGARDYDAEVGRWTAKDPIRFEGGDVNLYGYCGNDPVNCIDPSGLFFVPDWLKDVKERIEKIKEDIENFHENLWNELCDMGFCPDDRKDNKDGDKDASNKRGESCPK